MGPGQMGPGMAGPPPEEVIKSLPEGIQPAFKNALDTRRASARAHAEAEIKALEAVLKAFEETKQFAAKASDEDKAKIGKALATFTARHGQEGAGAPAGDLQQALDAAIQKFRAEIDNIKQNAPKN
jgi:molecular chaperone DnaK (HSP70)